MSTNRPYTSAEVAPLVSASLDGPHSRAEPWRVLVTAVELEEATSRLAQARQALEVIAEYACSHGDECPQRDPKCPSRLAHAVLAEPEEDEEE